VAPTEIPDPVRRFILDHIPSIERLEVLLLLFEARSRGWTVEEIEERIRSNAESIRANVSALTHGQLVTVDEAMPSLFRYRSSRQDETVSTLATLYRIRRVAVIELIYTERRGAVRSFSDAFKLGKPHDR
jgi:hypothetical protein